MNERLHDASLGEHTTEARLLLLQNSLSQIMRFRENLNCSWAKSNDSSDYVKITLDSMAVKEIVFLYLDSGLTSGPLLMREAFGFRAWGWVWRKEALWKQFQDITPGPNYVRGWPIIPSIALLERTLVNGRSEPKVKRARTWQCTKQAHLTLSKFSFSLDCRGFAPYIYPARRDLSYWEEVLSSPASGLSPGPFLLRGGPLICRLWP